MDIEQEVSWKTHIINFLKNDVIPKDKIQTQKIKYKMAKYYIVNEQLYRRSIPRLFFSAWAQEMSFLPFERHTKVLWRSCCNEDTCAQDPSKGLLLAHNESRRQGLCQKIS